MRDRLTYDMPPPVLLARDPERKLVLLGGLGVLGVGQMWFPETDEHRAAEGYAALPIGIGHFMRLDEILNGLGDLAKRSK